MSTNRTGASEQRYDAIVVDEGQDLDSVWWLPLLDLLRDRERGIVYVFGDAYRRRSRGLSGIRARADGTSASTA